jgi:sugar (pentulose or hexulose) kinase
MSYFCGIDIGASSAKLVIVDRDRHVLARAVRRPGDYSQIARRCSMRPWLPGLEEAADQRLSPRLRAG